jgi:hypothetical protein
MVSTNASEVTGPTAFRGLGHRRIQVRDPRIELIEQLQQLLPSQTSPRIEEQTFQFLSASLGPQLFLPAKALPHGQGVQLVHHRGTKANQFVPMPQHLPQIPLRR